MRQQPEQASRQAGILGVLAVVVAAITAGGAWVVVSRYQSELEDARRPKPTTQVVVAVADLPAGLPIAAESLELRGVNDDALVEGHSFTSLEAVTGKIPGDTVLAGETVRLERLLDGGAVVHADAAIEPGTRAVCVRVDRAASVAGLLEPGFFVDVIVTIRPDENSLGASWVTETILQGVRVVAINDRLLGSPDDENAEEEGRRRHVYVTVEVDPVEAEKLALATARGELLLSLRHAADQELLEQRGPLVTNALVGIADSGRVSPRSRVRRSRVVPPAVSGQTAEVIHGSDIKVEEFDETGRIKRNGRN